MLNLPRDLESFVCKNLTLGILFAIEWASPPVNLALWQRVERAKKLLIEKQLPIVDISYPLGFASQSHFTATFRRFTKVIPKVYQNIRASF